MTTKTEPEFTWRSKVKTPEGRLRELILAANPFGEAPKAIKLHLTADAGPRGSVRGWCHSTMPGAWQVSLVASRWQHVSTTTGGLLLSGNCEVARVLLHEHCHWIDITGAWAHSAGRLPDPVADEQGLSDFWHRAAFTRTLRLAETRCLAAGLLVEARRLSSRELPPTPAVPPPGAPAPLKPYPSPVGFWPASWDALRAFDGLSLAQVMQIGDMYSEGFPPPPDDWTPERGEVRGWTGSLHLWCLDVVCNDGGLWCHRTPDGMGATLAPSVFHAMRPGP